MRLFQYRLATLMIVMTFFAGALFLWMQFIVPHVTGFHVDGDRLVFHLSGEMGHRMFADDPYFEAWTGNPDAFIHDTYVSISLYTIAIALTVVLGLAIRIYVGFQMLRGRASRRAPDPFRRPN